MDSKNIVLALGSVAVLLLVGWWWSSMQPDNNQETTSQAQVTNPNDDTSKENVEETNVEPSNSENTEAVGSTKENNTFTRQEVATHSTADDCWVIIEGQVYDLSGFDQQHPGGSQPITSSCGGNATTLFQTRSGMGPHPASAQLALEQKLLGSLSE